MNTTRRIMVLPGLLFALACESESHPVAPAIQAMSFANSEWSEPMNLGVVVNSASGDQNPTVSPDGLSLYFTSNRAGGLGGNDIWVSHRGCDGCPWETPANLGPPINSANNDDAPGFSVDGHLLFFISARPGGQGLTDIYVSRRVDTHDDSGWETPVSLGPEVNTPGAEAGPQYLQSAEGGSANLYFNRAPVGGTQDIYYVSVTLDGEVRGPEVPVAELNDPAAGDAGPALRTDGREVIFFSDRAGTVGLNDLWVSTRRSVHDAWSIPANLGIVLNTAAADQQASLSHDGRTLLFASGRPGGFGGLDIWLSTRTSSGKEVP